MLKLVVTDLDGTLWDGVAGEDDIIPRQRVIDGLRRLSDSGVLVASCSHGNEHAARAVNRLGLSDMFVTEHYNVTDKVRVIREIAEEVGIGLPETAFVDDDPLQLKLVTNELGISVFSPFTWSPHAPALLLTDADKTRLEATRAAIQFNKGLREALDREAFLKSLNFHLRVELLNDENRARVEQLYERSNRLNLNGRKPEGLVFALRTSSDIDPAGVNGAFSLQLHDDFLALETMVLSCRLVGREFEGAAFVAANLLAKKLNYWTSALVLDEVSDTGRNDLMIAAVEKWGLSEEPPPWWTIECL